MIKKKKTDKGNRRKKGFLLLLGLRMQSIMTWWQEPEVAGHLTSTIRKLREVTGLRAHFPFYSAQDPSPLDDATPIQGGSSHLN